MDSHPKIHLETLVYKMVTQLSYGLSWPDDVFIVLLHFNNVWRRVRYSKVRLVYHRPHNWRFCYPYHPPKKGADRNLVTLCYTVPRSTTSGLTMTAKKKISWVYKPKSDWLWIFRSNVISFDLVSTFSIKK